MAPRFLAVLTLLPLLPAQAPTPFFALSTAPAPGALVAPQPDQSTTQERAERAWRRLAALDPTQGDLAARAAALPADLAAIAAVLANEIGYDAYSGVLRGAQGTYAQRAGNTFDRALLLASLLTSKGLPVRFQRGRLPQDRCAQLVDKLFAARPLDPTRPSAVAGSLPARVRARAARDFAAVRAVAAELPIEVDDRDTLLAEVKDHVWVQVQRDGAWFDVDPLFADVPLGKTATSAEETWDRIPAEQHQTITLRVVTEQFRDGNVATATPLAVTLPAVDWLEQQVFLLHLPAASIGGSIANALGGGDQAWRPVLLLGDEARAGEPIHCGTGVRSGALDALSTEDPATAAPADSPWIAEWLELELRTPDGRCELHRRALLDRAGAALRAAGTFTQAQLAPLPADAQGPLCTRDVHNLAFSAGRRDLAEYQHAIAWLSETLAAAERGETTLPGQDGRDPGVAALWPLALQTMGWLLGSDHQIVPGLDDLPGVRLYPEMPRIWIASILRTGATADATDFVLDLRRDRLRGICADASQRQELAARKLWFALLEGALEHEVLASMAVQGGLDAGLIATTSSALGAAGCRLARVADDLAAVATGALATAHATAALQRGSWIVAPLGATATTADDVAFWEIESNGDARAVYGLDWNGALLPRVTTMPRAGKFPGGPPKNSYSGGSLRPPNHYNPGNNTGGSGPGTRTWSPGQKFPNGSTGGPGGGGGPKGGGARGPSGRSGPQGGRGGGASEYIALLLNISIPAAYGWFVVGLAVEVTAGYAATMFMDAGML